MDANKFMVEYKRMCASYGNCQNCPMREDNNGHCTEVPSRLSEEFTYKVTKVVEEWSAAHPRKTRQSVFLEQYPETKLDKCGVITICPAELSSIHRNNYGGCKNMNDVCVDCCHEFWMQEVK